MDETATRALVDAAEEYRAACLREAAVLDVMGDVTRGTAGLMVLLEWHTYAFDAANEAKFRLMDAAQVVPVWSAPTHPGARAQRIY